MLRRIFALSSAVALGLAATSALAGAYPSPIYGTLTATTAIVLPDGTSITCGGTSSGCVALGPALAVEAATARAAEQANAASIAAELVRAKAVEATNASGVSTNATAIGTEATRAQAAEAKALQAANNLSDVPAPATARTNLGLVAVAASGSASDLGAGTLPPARLPAPSTTTLGGVQALTASGNAFLTGIGTNGAPTSAQPSFSNLSGSATAAQMPALTGDVATSAGSTATTIQPGVVTNTKLAAATAGTVKANTGSSAAAPSDVTPSALLDAAFGSTQGGILYRGAAAWTLLGPGSPGQVLGSGGSGANPAWQNAGGNGTVTSVAVAVPSDETVSGSPVTSSGTITISRNAQAANTVLAGPTSGSTATPAFRALVTADLPMASLPYNGLKNRLFDGAMAVDQRNSGGSVTLSATSAYTVDRWFGWTGASPASETAQRVSVLSGGVAYAERLARASGATATAAMNLGQVLETVPNVDLQGRTVTLSLKARAGANFSGSGLSCYVATGTDADKGSTAFVAGTGSGGWTGYAVAGSATFALTTSFQIFALQATIPAGATEIGVSCGFTPSGTAGSADYADLSDVQLEPGAFTAAQVTFERRPLNVETALCQRFFVQWTTTTRADLATGLAYSTTGTVFPMTLPVPMRATPAINSSTIAVLNGSGSQVNGSSQAVQAATDKTVEIAIGASGLTVGQASVLTIGTGSGGLLSLSAEL